MGSLHFKNNSLRPLLLSRHVQMGVSVFIGSAMTASSSLNLCSWGHLSQTDSR